VDQNVSGPQPRPGILQAPAYVGGASKAEGANRSIKLSSNECALGCSEKAVEAYQSVATDLHRYPDGGATELREALAKHHDLELDRIVCGDGSDEVLYMLTRAYAGIDEEVLFHQHGFVVYRLASLGAGATPVTAPEVDCRADVDALLAAVTDKTRIVFLTNPGAVGTYVTEGEVRRLHAGLRDDILLVVDEAYAEYVTAEDYTPSLELARTSENVVVTRTFSKAYGLAAVRLGWCYAPATVADVLNRLRSPFNVTVPAQAAGVAALEDQGFVDRVVAHNEEWRPWLETSLKDQGYGVIPSVTNFIMVKFKDEAEADAAAKHLEKHGLLVRDMRAYGLGDHLRITVGLGEECRAVDEAMGTFRSA
jgi:histidinol-phosphate aminotransferase